MQQLLTRRLVPVFAVGASLLAAAPALAAKATVDYGSGTLSFQAGAGEANRLSISQVPASANVQIYDKALASIALDQIGSTVACGLPELYKLRCPLSGLKRAEVRLGDGNDDFDFSLDLPVTVTAGAGAKAITTAGGDDTIDLRNGSADQVSCGAGTDVVYADPADTVASDCELVNPPTPAPEPGAVNVPPVPGVPTAVTGAGNSTSTSTPTAPAGGADPAPATSSAGDQSAFGLSVATLAVAVPRPNTAVVALTCAARATAGCRGEIVLLVPDPPAKKHAAAAGRVIAARGHYMAQQRHRARRIGRRHFKLAAGQSLKLPVRITLRGHFVLASRRRKRMKAVLQVTERNAAGQIASVRTRSVTLRLETNKWGHR